MRGWPRGGRGSCFVLGSMGAHWWVLVVPRWVLSKYSRVHPLVDCDWDGNGHGAFALRLRFALLTHP